MSVLDKVFNLGTKWLIGLARSAPTGAVHHRPLAPLLLAGPLALGNTVDNPLGVRLVGPAALLVLASFVIFRPYTLPDEPRVGESPSSNVAASPTSDR